MKIWKDPVWSKVIAAIIIGTFTLITSLTVKEWTVQIFVVFILIAIIFVLLLFIGNLKSIINRLYYYDREYKKMAVHYYYSLNQEKDSLDLKVIGEREIKCLTGRINYLDIGFTVDECFHKHYISENPILIEQKRNYNRQIIIHKPHKITESNINFRVEFQPALEKNEIAFFKYSFSVAKFRFATIELLKEKLANSVVVNRNFEYNSFMLNFPTQYFEFIVEFEKSCKVSSADIEVTRYTDLFIEEDKLIKESEKYISLYHDKNGSYIIELKRINPPLKCRYKWKWYPPTKDEINDSAPNKV